MPKPFLRWAGGKTQLLPKIEAAWPDSFGTYYEPFLGGASVFLALRPIPALLSDLNSDLINCYGWVQVDANGVLADFDDLEREYLGANVAKRQVIYYRTRELFASTPTGSRVRAATFLFLNKTCWNGLWRVNQQGHFNVPHGQLKSRRLLEQRDLRSAADALRGADLRASDYKEVLLNVKKDDLVYLDPPYSPTGRNFHEYQQGGFPLALQYEVADEAVRCVAIGAHVIVSNSDDPMIKEIYEQRGFIHECQTVRRAINSVTTHRSGHSESLFYSASIVDVARTRQLPGFTLPV